MKLFKVVLVDTDKKSEDDYILSSNAKNAIHDMLSFRADGWTAKGAVAVE